MNPVGSTAWALATGDIPVSSTGPEPEFSSHDRLCVLNTGERDTDVQLTVYFADQDPAGPYRLTVGAGRVRHVRINDLIDPEAVPLGVPYGCVVRASSPVVVQFYRQDTRQAANAVTAMPAVALPNST